ncbi:MAG TPA: hypothetical protein VHM91_23115 [Verrucomicrobiales bacterium]|nr:hypothetical protein [Verrucomicrobiales bacterium]
MDPVEAKSPLQRCLDFFKNGVRGLGRFWVSWHMLMWGTAGFLAGYLAMPNVTVQMNWLIVTCLPAAAVCLWKSRGRGIVREPFFWLTSAFLLWNITVGTLRNPEFLALDYTRQFLGGAVLLPVYLVALWLIGRRGKSARVLVQAVAWAGFAAAAAALYYWWWIQSVEEPGARLRNPLVHSGLHPVTTGITIGFATVAAAALYGGTLSRGVRVLLTPAVGVMCLAVLLTLSRGALLAMSAGLLALPLALLASMPLRSAWKKAGPPVLMAAAVISAFLMFAGALAPDPPAAAPVDVVLSDHVVQDYFRRGDSGRANFHRCGLECLDSWDKHLTGAGLWVAEAELEKRTGGHIDHLHSVFVATYVHSGLIGLSMLALLLLMGFRRAWALARAGQPVWLVLLVCGITTLIYDGQSACSLRTHARFENLVLWFPLIVTAAAWRNENEHPRGQTRRLMGS